MTPYEQVSALFGLLEDLTGEDYAFLKSLAYYEDKDFTDAQVMRIEELYNKYLG